jgi:hypothetical protein
MIIRSWVDVEEKIETIDTEIFIVQAKGEMEAQTNLNLQEVWKRMKLVVDQFQVSYAKSVSVPSISMRAQIPKYLPSI